MAVSQNTTNPVNSGEASLVGCELKCQQTVPAGQILDFHIVAPWVVITFKNDKGFVLTIGNSSFYSNNPKYRNSAVIKDFTYGASDGTGIEFTVHDQLGSPFETFIKRLNKKFNQSATDYTMQARFGWIARDCDGRTYVHPFMKSPVLTFIPISIENTYNDGGKISYLVSGADLLSHLAQSRVAKPQGTDGKPRPLEEAIRGLFREKPDPSGIEVEFLRQAADGSGPEIKEWKFDGNTEAPYQTSNRSKPEIAMDWISNHLTDRKRPVWKYTFDPSKAVPTIQFWELPYNSTETVKPLCLKQYTVNAGKNSPVVSFSPKAKMAYLKIQNQTGGTIGVGGVKAFRGKGLKGLEDQKGAGIQHNSVAASKNSVITALGTGSDVALKVMENQLENTRMFFPFTESVSAELVIQGDPSDDFTKVTRWVGRTLSIIVINPFHLLVNFDPLEGTDSDLRECPTWLAEPMCNPVFTSNMWYIQKVNHSIKAGSYLTTVSLMLLMPGVDIAGNQLGDGQDTPLNQ